VADWRPATGRSPLPWVSDAPIAPAEHETPAAPGPETSRPARGGPAAAFAARADRPRSPFAGLTDTELPVGPAVIGGPGGWSPPAWPDPTGDAPEVELDGAPRDDSPAPDPTDEGGHRATGRRSAGPRPGGPTRSGRAASSKEARPVEQARSERVRSEPVRSEPVRSEPTRSEPVRSGPTGTEPGHREPVTAVVAPPRRTRLTADAINHESMVLADERVPGLGWRRTLYSATGGRMNLGIGAAEREWLDLLAQVRRPITGARQIAVTSIKGGVGKTTVAACLGLMLAEYRGDGVVAVDADPDAGTLADRLSGEPTSTVRDLLTHLDSISSLSELGRYTSLAGRLRVLAGDQDPAMSEAFRREEYQEVCGALARFFDIVITDSGTGMVHSAMRGTLEIADRLIVVGTPTVDGASRASKTLDWLFAHGHEKLAEEAVLVLSQDRGSERVDAGALREHFAARCAHVVEVPADPHLYSGGRIDPALLRPETREAYLQLAAVVAQGFSG
jgi:MinD-like ATPase involved in chromosome partitioning or flagellar assembly